MPAKPNTRQLILEAVTICIEKYGLDKVTTRRIASEAGTNLASINYYFHSKDDLVTEALSMTIKHMLQDVLEAIADAEQPFETTLRSVIFYLLDGSLRFPGISAAHLNQAIVDREPESISSQAIAKVFEGLVKRAIHAYPGKDARILRLRLSQTLSSILFTMLTPGFFRVGGGHGLTSSKNAGKLADSYTSLFLDSI